MARKQQRKFIDCVRCNRYRESNARNLCTSCYVLECRHGRLDDWPKTQNGSRANTEDYLFIMSTCPAPFADVARRMGLHPDSLEQSLARCGVERIVWPIEENPDPFSKKDWRARADGRLMA